MSELVLALGTGLVGVSIGYVLGLLTKHWTAPTVMQVKKALEANDEYHKKLEGRLKRQIGEYNQPPELQSVATAINQGGIEGSNMIEMITNALPTIKGIPTWMRPMIPAVTGWLKENPDQVDALVKKFAFSGGRGGVGSGDGEGDSL